MALELTSLLSPDNHTRKAAEAAFDQLRTQQPQLLASQLIAGLSQGGDAQSELCAVLARRYLPPLFGLAECHFSAEAREHVKAGLLANLTLANRAPSLRRKLCSLIGRLGAEFHTDGAWPELSAFIAGACAEGTTPEVHESALSVLSHMAPALVEPTSWAACGQSVQAMLVDGLGPTHSPEVRQAALSSLAALLRTSAAAEQEAEKQLLSPADEKARKTAKTSRKAYRAIGQSLGEALPLALGALEGALQTGGTDVTTALESLSEVAENQPRLFRPVLPQVLEGMASLALSAQLLATQRIAAIEVLVTLAETQPKMCLKVGGFAARMVSTLLSMMLTLGEDCSAWEEVEPSDGMNEDDDGSEEDQEAAYAAEALDRVVTAIEGTGVTEVLLPQLEALANGAAWQHRHAALTAVGMVCETCAPSLLPHLGALTSLVASGAAAPEPRVRHAAIFALSLLSDEFEQIASEQHASTIPLLLRGIGDASRRVQAAAALGVGNVSHQMERETLEPYAPELFSALHSLLAASPPPYIAFASVSALCQLFDTLGRSAAPAYATFMPMFRSGFEAAVGAKAHKLAGVLLSAIGSLAAAVGEDTFRADAEATVAPLVELLLRQRPMLSESSLLEPLHASLAKMASPMGAPFGRYFAVVLPTLLEAAAVEPEVQTDVVEEQLPEGEDDESVDTHYVSNRGCGFLRVRVNSAQMEEKLMGVSALHEYAEALGAGFTPFAPACVEAASSLLGYRFHPRVRLSSAYVLGDAVKALVAAASAAEHGASVASAASLVGALLKPLGEAVHTEKELEPLDGLLTVLLDVLRLQRLEGCALLSPPQLNGLVGLLKHGLHLDAKRGAARAESAAEEDAGEGAPPDEEELEQEWEILLTLVHAMRELLRQHGAAIVPTLEAQLLPAVGAWLGGDDNHVAAGLYCLADLVDFGGADAAKKYSQLALPHINAAIGLEEGRERRLAAAASALGA
eukprot:CAMPEP_0183335620 /NCGR_PEP_ID=MMETSP0164_2-20130417/3864_1 /TAXON_ID=221442 /ORGANISM="Coccolithus pelagicus ssp braarudi, Strain PLY182g" /LENGTH=969 /DNA_ID=CAMNT_0025505013 /DNA_START=25 /DNA_END=2930 /DNA_ORIENTATION=-